LQRLLVEPIVVTMMTPQMLRAIVSAAARVSSRRAHSASHGLQVIVGAGAVTPELDRACRDVLGVGVSRNYGSTETGATFGGPPRDDASLGPPFNGVDILEPAPLGRGELVLRLPERSDKPYRTGDIVVRQANDVVEVVGRVDEMAKINGYNVDTEALAAAARRLPGVADAVAVVVPRPESSEIVDLYLLLAGSAVDADAARHALLNDRPLLRASLRITNCRELPRDAVGKISKADVMNLIDRTTKWHGPS
jgi:acyl-coenzyme A synthetase/AMP-(fatty) acid ligase